MKELIDRIRDRLANGAYTNEAAVSHGILMPILQLLGWDGTDPEQIIPEYSSGKGRVDFALCTSGRRPAVFVEVKGVGRSVDGDRQLFEYAFHQGVPICLLTDGRDWSFYLPSGQGSYDERRLYRLQIDDRSSAEAERVFKRYLARDRIISGEAVDDAAIDYRNAAAKRDAARALPRAWDELVAEREELLIELLSDKAEALCGFRPREESVGSFLASLRYSPDPVVGQPQAPIKGMASSIQGASPKPIKQTATPAANRAITYMVLGHTRSAPNAAGAFLDVLKSIAERNPDKLPELAVAARGRSRNHIAQTVEEIYPKRPDLARAAEIAPGWLVGLNIANREKARIISAAMDVFGLQPGRDVDIRFPNE